MGLINLEYTMHKVSSGHRHLTLTTSEFQRFNASILGLGDISKEGTHLDALAAIFDLESFTSFCNQIDPQLVVPEYLDQLLNWLFYRISNNFVKEGRKDIIIMWGKFPFFAKFLGDGILFLWETQGLGQASLGNMIINLYKVCTAYMDEFLPKIEKTLTKVPRKLRCGVARGEVISIGGGKDFVGPCINMAARLQKVSQLSFAFPRKGFDPQQCFSANWQSQFVAKKILIRGIGEDELVLICRKEYEALPETEKTFFKNP